MQIKSTELQRDAATGALINKDLEAFRRYKKEREDQKTIRVLLARVEALEKKVQELTEKVNV